MTGIVIFAAIALALLVLIIFLTCERSEHLESLESRAKYLIENQFPSHYRYFPQVRQALSKADPEYLKRRASKTIQRQVQAERREVARKFLLGLKEDFSRLDRLGRTVAALSPEVTQAKEAERFWLALRFQIIYRLVRLRLQTGSVCLPQLTQLTKLVGSFASRIETAITSLEDASLAQLVSGFKA